MAVLSVYCMAKRTYRVLVLLDHGVHNRPTISVYGILSSMVQHSACECIDVVSRAHPLNHYFFINPQSTAIYVTKVTPDFRYQEDHKQFSIVREAQLSDYDVIILRLPPPLCIGFLSFLTKHYPRKRIINDPYWMPVVGSKDYLLRFPELCPEMLLCGSINDITAFAQKFPIVLKPLRAHGGHGIVRIDGDTVYEEGTNPISLDTFLAKLRLQPYFEYLGMKYLKNVFQGDKRILVINGRIIGACLRMPSSGSWLCNVSQGGHPAYAEPDTDEIAIAKRLSEDFKKKGIVIFGFDTLTDDSGKRVLSEINAINVGGFVNAQMTSGMPVISTTVNLMWQYISLHVRPIPRIISMK